MWAAIKPPQRDVLVVGPASAQSDRSQTTQTSHHTATTAARPQWLRCDVTHSKAAVVAHSNIKMFGWFAAHAALNPALRTRSRARIIAQGQAADPRSSNAINRYLRQETRD